jgi:hypothetical protein
VALWVYGHGMVSVDEYIALILAAAVVRHVSILS